MYIQNHLNLIEALLKWPRSSNIYDKWRSKW